MSLLFFFIFLFISLFKTGSDLDLCFISECVLGDQEVSDSSWLKIRQMGLVQCKETVAWFPYSAAAPSMQSEALHAAHAWGPLVLLLIHSGKDLVCTDFAGQVLKKADKIEHCPLKFWKSPVNQCHKNLTPNCVGSNGWHLWQWRNYVTKPVELSSKRKTLTHVLKGRHFIQLACQVIRGVVH